MRVDGPTGVLAFDNMQQRGVTGSTEWTRYEIELDVAEDAVNINFGVLLTGNGTAWFDSLAFEFASPPNWFAVPHPMREIGAVFAGEEQMSHPVVIGEHYDGIVFVDQTTRARPVRRTQDPD